MALRTLFKRMRKESTGTPLFFYNTLGKEKQRFELHSHTKEIRMYNCGPTVYGRQHIGNLSMFVFTDILRRTLEYNGFAVKQVINFTDFGHLSSDADEGEDKMTKGLKHEGLAPTLENMKALGEKYANLFLEDVRALNIEADKITFPRASDYIPAQIAMIQTLEEKGYAYRGKHGVYFDTSRFPEYGKLGNIDLAGLREGARVASIGEKHNPTDFLLWKSDTHIGWNSPWGKGFPGWHIECSAMIRSCLGAQIDIHTGGIEHIPVHHNNEIAQSESATGKKPLSRFWLHRAHLQFDGGKMAKSEGNIVYLSDIIERGFHPLSFRYLLLGSHYRTSSNFSWEALEAAQTAYKRLSTIRMQLPTDEPVPDRMFLKEFHERINDDLDTPGALAVLWNLLTNDAISSEAKLASILEADKIFGLKLNEPEALKAFSVSYVDVSDAPAEIKTALADREKARAERDFARADALRDTIRNAGYDIEDTAGGARLIKV
jgi:cysteinyl-tRNA synthetase